MSAKKDSTEQLSPGRKTTQLQVRISEYHLNKAKILAKRYADGNLSNWVLYAIFKAPRKFLSKDFKPR